MANINELNINELDLTPYKNKVNDYILKKQVVMDENYTVEDVLVVGLRKLAREKIWQEKHGSTNQKAKMDALKKGIVELGGNVEDYLAKM